MWFKRHQSLTMALGIGGLAVLLILIAIIPIYQNANIVLGKIKTKTTELEALTDKVSILSKLDPNILDERMKTLDNALPPRKDVLLYLSSIDGLSRELGLTLGGLTLSPGEISLATESVATKSSKAAGLQSLATEVKISGGQESIYTFLRSVEEVLPLMQIKDVKVSIAGEDQYSLSLSLGMLWADPGTMDVKGQVTLFGTEEEKYFTQLSAYRKFDQVIEPSIVEAGKSNLFAPPLILQQ